MENRKKLPLKLIFVAAAMFVVLAFSMALTTTTSAQQAATATPTATESPTATSVSPATGATATPGATGSTGSIPVTGANQAPNTARALAFTRAVNRLSNVSDNNLEDRYNELLAKLRREERMLNSMNNKLNQFTKRLGKNAFAFNNNANNNNANNNNANNNNAQNQNQNGLNASDNRNRHLQAIQQDFLSLARNVAIARQQVLLAQIALNSRASFNANGNLNNRQAAINALAIAEISLDRGMSALRQFNNIAEAR